MGDTSDLATLPCLDSITLLKELRARYTRDKIYTNVGDILVSLNPFKPLPIFGNEQRNSYRSSSNSDNPPHVFAVASGCYHQMMTSGKNQCCVISGESGAGKTESCKHIVAHLIELSRVKSVLEQRILQVNPLLEAFGNAKTLMNDNSSRFGKYLQLKFKGGHVTGAKINEYLLEKSRVVFQNRGEQNFHIFYNFLVGLDSERRTQYRLDYGRNFNYLSGGTEGLGAHSLDKRQQFEEVMNALDLVGFESEFQDHIFSCLAAILHIGNIEFSEDENECAHVADHSADAIQIASELIGIEPGMIMDAMLVSVSVARGEMIRKRLSKQKAQAVRDAVSKAVYDRIFRWIVNRINQLLAPTIEDMEGETEIGILDIFGFEKFEINSFEQLCINLANEQLQFFFNEHIFSLEQREYQIEGISLVGSVSFQDNKPLLDMFLGKPIGLLSLLDEQSSFPQATDLTFVTKMNQNFRQFPTYIPPKGSSGSFTIHHYAGKVEYAARGFLEKNRDTMPMGATEVLRTSSNELIKLIFLATVTRTGTLAIGTLANKRTGRLKSKIVKKEQQKSASIQAPSVGSQFKNSLQVLVEKMNQATPHFIRCIKPNAAKLPNHFVDEYVTTQLSYTGMLETARIRQAGYAYRLPFAEFAQRYDVLLSPRYTSADPVTSCRGILHYAKITDYQIGKTKIFLKYWHLGTLDTLVEKVSKAASTLQKNARRFFQQRKFKALLAAKKEQEQLLADFLSGVPKGVEGLYPRQMALCEEDLERPKEALLKARNTINQVPVIAPPSDINAPPPEPYIKDDDSAWAQDSDEVARRSVDEDGFVAVSKGNRFGPEGTRNASLRWFKETQARHVLRADGTVCEWFHGFISKRRSEELLDGKPEGSYLVRTNDTHFGYHLSIRKGKRGCGHYLISQLEAGKFVLAGEHKVHRGLVQLLEHHMRYPMSDNTCLTQPCCNQPGSCQELLGGADLSPPAPSPKGAGRRGVPPPPSHPEIQQKRSKLNSIDSKPLQQVF
ncbi:hypothetical protein EMCRGX_G022508 [Ephydatia muelleri]